MHTPPLFLLPRDPSFLPGSADAHAAHLSSVFGASLAAAHDRGATDDALVSHLLPLVRLFAVHGPPAELATHLRALFELRDPRGEARVLVERLAGSLARTGRRSAAQRLRKVARHRSVQRRPEVPAPSQKRIASS